MLDVRIGSGAMQLVNEGDIKAYSTVMLLTEGVTTASKQVSATYGVETLETASAVLIFGTAVLVTGTIIRTSIDALKRNRERGLPLTH